MDQKITSKEAPAISRDEIARLAHLNWETDGRPHGDDQKYWLEAEQQIKATRHLLISELSPSVNQTPVTAKPKLDGKLKSSRRQQRARLI